MDNMQTLCRKRHAIWEQQEKCVEYVHCLFFLKECKGDKHQFHFQLYFSVPLLSLTHARAIYPRLSLLLFLATNEKRFQRKEQRRKNEKKCARKTKRQFNEWIQIGANFYHECELNNVRKKKMSGKKRNIHRVLLTSSILQTTWGKKGRKKRNCN